MIIVFMDPNPPRAQPTASPCIGVCLLSEARVCQGCGRHIDEIAAWGGASEAQRRAIVDRARARMLIIGNRFTGSSRR